MKGDSDDVYFPSYRKQEAELIQARLYFNKSTRLMERYISGINKKPQQQAPFDKDCVIINSLDPLVAGRSLCSNLESLREGSSNVKAKKKER
mmetsp:Transcript_6967/g.12882  ORF Transcript_6967/g.12882 Transcript_6967/m.12882 type:complete len:92 (+) Transcript_6967:21-296(+)